MATVQLGFSPVPANVRTARLIASTVGRRSGLDDSLVDEVKLAVGEACARAVGMHRRHDVAADVEVSFVDDDATFTVTVVDAAPDDTELPMLDLVDVAADLDSDLPSGFGLAVVAGLVDDVEVTSTGRGTVVRMRWPIKA
ncbi:MAG TPA: ATP-binding protein [Mycobacteriales bacterium]|nr:ATP-binding protein [Mycobacteriales bacterium]